MAKTGSHLLQHRPAQPGEPIVGDHFEIGKLRLIPWKIVSVDLLHDTEGGLGAVRDPDSTLPFTAGHRPDKKSPG